MISTPELTFKIASEPSEFEQIYRLNYKTFVEEIPQHESNEDNRLIDRYEEQSTYIICLDGEQIIGMLAVHGDRPFSLDHKLEDLDAYFPEDRSICEIRLLAVEKAYRNGRVFLGLARHLIEYCIRNGYDMAIISGTTREQKLYKHLGFEAFGPLVGKGEALYQPMYLSKEKFEKKETMYKRLDALPKDARKQPISFLPGPVNLEEKVQEAFRGEPLSHRSLKFVEDFQDLKGQLCAKVGARHVEIFLGSGTLGNDIVAGQLSLLGSPGLILSNGEFGNRLLDHGSRAGLSFHKLTYSWGEMIDYEEVQAMLEQHPEIQWLWCAHCETSTGILNDIEYLKNLSAEADFKLCLDCCSSLGTVPLDLGGIYLASSSSGKGLGSYAGLSMVFYHHDIEPNASLPRYLDLGLYAAKQGVPFTHSSNLVYALKTALTRFEDQDVFQKQLRLAAWLRDELKQIGLETLGTQANSTPAIVTIPLPEGLSSEEIGSGLDQAGYLLSYRSEYLLARNWIQISLMGKHSRRELRPLLNELSRLCVR